jgi:hypothetical protein
MLRWRDESGVNEMRQELVQNNWDFTQVPLYNRVIKHLCSSYNHNTDKLGNIVIIDRIGLCSSKTLCADVSTIKSCVWLYA